MRTTLITLLFLFLISCKNSSTDAGENEDTLIEESDSVLLTADKLPWIAEYDTVKGEFALKKQRIVAETETAQKLITDINDAWENVKLVFQKISHDTLYVAIPQSEFLTERMGSSGSAEYMTTTTYILTELKNIKFVNYSFKEGEHLSPGVFDRTDFKDFH